MASTFSVDGIVSGLKTADIIGQLMALERQPVQLLQKQQAEEQNKLSGVNAIKDQVSALQAILASLAQNGSVDAKTVTTDTPSTSPAILTATASAGAINGSFRVLVSQLATATRLASSGPIGRAIDRAATLANAGFRITPVTTVNDNPASFRINGSSVSVDATTTLDDGTASSLISKINAA
ncbi:MAG: hypothetical protein IT356_13200, partial [Gemmatimonadaceae bacterium]|nr:hypothetical protein [Gemmatimonadaceae bacterium]